MVERTKCKCIMCENIIEYGDGTICSATGGLHAFSYIPDDWKMTDEEREKLAIESYGKWGWKWRKLKNRVHTFIISYTTRCKLCKEKVDGKYILNLGPGPGEYEYVCEKCFGMHNLWERYHQLYGR